MIDHENNPNAKHVNTQINNLGIEIDSVIGSLDRMYETIEYGIPKYINPYNRLNLNFPMDRVFFHFWMFLTCASFQLNSIFIFPHRTLRVTRVRAIDVDRVSGRFRGRVHPLVRSCLSRSHNFQLKHLNVLNRSH